jgi:hypothetical protein
MERGGKKLEVARRTLRTLTLGRDELRRVAGGARKQADDADDGIVVGGIDVSRGRGTVAGQS